METKYTNGDPVGANEPRGKSNAARKGRYDGSFTGTEQRIKNQLMRQFMRTGEGGGMGWEVGQQPLVELGLVQA